MLIDSNIEKWAYKVFFIKNPFFVKNKVVLWKSTSFNCNKYEGYL